ncbi:hypothetical protein THF5H11_490001 [Vibrio jasicida]|nr:hypothetical protein THF5H11_490001 [Vibrio jasicida]
MVGRDGSVVLNCLSCGSVINVWRDIWEGVQKGAQPYTHVVTDSGYSAALLVWLATLVELAMFHCLIL